MTPTPATPHHTLQLRRCSCESELLPPTLDPTGPRVVPNTAFFPSLGHWTVSSPEATACSSPREGQQRPGPCTQVPQVPSCRGVLFPQCFLQALSTLHWKLFLSELPDSTAEFMVQSMMKPSVRAPSRPKSHVGLRDTDRLEPSVCQDDQQGGGRRERPCLEFCSSKLARPTQHLSFIQ